MVGNDATTVHIAIYMIKYTAINMRARHEHTLAFRVVHSHADKIYCQKFWPVPSVSQFVNNNKQTKKKKKKTFLLLLTGMRRFLNVKSHVKSNNNKTIQHNLLTSSVELCD